jgi:hypothetical protein
LVLTVVADSLRAEDEALRLSLLGATEIHLCRHAECRADEGMQHFKIYGLAKPDMKKYHIDSAVAQSTKEVAVWSRHGKALTAPGFSSQIARTSPARLSQPCWWTRRRQRR